MIFYPPRTVSVSPDEPAVFYNIMNELSATEVELCDASVEFGFELFKQIEEQLDPADNIFMSPVSLSFCLGMIYNGAAGETREEIAQALQLSGFNDQEINSGYKNIAYLLHRVDPSVECLLADSIWSQMGYPFLLVFLEICIHCFQAEAQEIDF
ncbi:MAG: serpin family protein, partial [Planctomycetota bacterium]